MPRTLALMLSLVLLAAPLASAQSEPSDGYDAVNLMLPKGDPAAGRTAFQDLKCTTCHPVAGDRVLPHPTSRIQAPQLSSDMATDDLGALATSIVSPSHVISSRISDAARRRMSGRLSPMADFSNVMTVRQLADLIAYIREDVPPMVALQMETRMEGNDLTIDGSTDFPDGTILTYEIRHDRMPIDHETPEWMMFEQGVVTVSGGRFHAVVDASRLDPGLFEVYVAFRTDLPKNAQQPAPVLAAFGPHGEKLMGPNVVLAGETGRAVQVTRTVMR